MSFVDWGLGTFFQEGQTTLLGTAKEEEYFLPGIPSLPSSGNVRLQRLSPLPPQPLPLEYLEHPQVQSPPSAVHFPSSLCQLVHVCTHGLFSLCPAALAKRMRKVRTSFSASSLCWREPEMVPLARKRSCLSAHLKSTLGDTGVPVRKVTLFFLCRDASQGSMLYSHNPVYFHSPQPWVRTFHLFTRPWSTIYPAWFWAIWKDTSHNQSLQGCRRLLTFF